VPELLRIRCEQGHTRVNKGTHTFEQRHLNIGEVRASVRSLRLFSALPYTLVAYALLSSFTLLFSFTLLSSFPAHLPGALRVPRERVLH